MQLPEHRQASPGALPDTAIGITWSPFTRRYLGECPDAFDYIEVAFEQLRAGTNVTDFPVPTILHCASLSVAGFVDPQPALIEEVASCADAISTPWIGEHLAFLSARSLTDSDKTLTSGFTLAPQLSQQTVSRVVDTWERLQAGFGVPLILENPPQYFPMPGSTMNMAEFMAEICVRCDCGLLLDLAHLLISAHNLGHDPFEMLRSIPWDRVLELHLADGREYAGVLWDNHAGTPDAQLWEMLQYSLERCSPRAITLEYNWLLDYDAQFFGLQVEKIRQLLQREACYAGG